ncbi:MAG TPA: DUF3592 domain-containing protein [Tepidisphaeraceae bacterium]|jgi:hypothetical protein|nr:DUF3592 domain-containing protein [Tepidisphaeraceae bacterium]
MVTYVLIFMAAVFFATTLFLLVRFYFTDRRRMTSITEGRVLTAAERTVIERDLRKIKTDITATYTARGKDYQVHRTIEGSKATHFPPGRPINIRYNPGEPDMSEIML